MKRVQQIVRVKPEAWETYRGLHADPWPGVNRMIKECHIQNYSISYYDGFLFAYFEYTGGDYEADMAKMAADPQTQRWWDVCKPCLLRMDTETVSDCWSDMQEIYYLP